MIEKASGISTDESSIWPHVLDPLKQFGEKVAGYFAPAADAATTVDAYEINIELPGVKQDDVVVELHDHLLLVKGEKRSDREVTDKNFYFSERRFGSFHRAFRLPENVDSNDITASYVDGVLTLRVAKKGASPATTTRIPIKQG